MFNKNKMILSLVMILCLSVTQTVLAWDAPCDDCQSRDSEGICQDDCSSSETCDTDGMVCKTECSDDDDCLSEDCAKTCDTANSWCEDDDDYCIYECDTCSGGECVANDDECTDPEKCFKKYSDFYCAECEDNDDCLVGVCDTNTGKCTDECTSNSDCEDPALPFCNIGGGYCVECMEDADCSSNPNGSDCTPGNYVCEECLVDGDCTDPAKPKCNSDTPSACVECTQDYHCTSGHCHNADDVCVECETDAHCTVGCDTICDIPTGICISPSECTTDDDCGDCQVCSSCNACEYPSECVYISYAESEVNECECDWDDCTGLVHDYFVPSAIDGSAPGGTTPPTGCKSTSVASTIIGEDYTCTDTTFFDDPEPIVDCLVDLASEALDQCSGVCGVAVGYCFRVYLATQAGIPP